MAGLLPCVSPTFRGLRESREQGADLGYEEACVGVDVAVINLVDDALLGDARMGLVAPGADLVDRLFGVAARVGSVYY